MAETEHPVDRLDDYEFISWAQHAAESLQTFGYAFVRMSPGDGTCYQIVIVHPLDPREWARWEHQAAQEGAPPPHPATGDYYVATQFGPMYPWPGEAPGDWSYVFVKWTQARPGTPDEWTARVLYRFLCTLEIAINQRGTS